MSNNNNEFTSIRRLLKEQRDFQQERNSSPEIISLNPIEDADLYQWRALIAGPTDTPFEGGIFELAIAIPLSYPIRPPQVHFLTRVCHPNVHFKTGEICLDILKNNWSPAWTLRAICQAIALLLANPEPDSPLNIDAANMIRCQDLVAYDSIIRMYTTLYASSSTSSFSSNNNL